MSFTEQDRLNQAKMAAEIAAEFGRLEAQFADLMKESGLTEAELAKLAKMYHEGSLPPDVKASLDEIRHQAERAGDNQAAQAKGAGTQEAPNPNAWGAVLRG